MLFKKSLLNLLMLFCAPSLLGAGLPFGQNGLDEFTQKKSTEKGIELGYQLLLKEASYRLDNFHGKTPLQEAELKETNKRTELAEWQTYNQKIAALAAQHKSLMDSCGFLTKYQDPTTKNFHNTPCGKQWEAWEKASQKLSEKLSRQLCDEEDDSEQAKAK